MSDTAANASSRWAAWRRAYREFRAGTTVAELESMRYIDDWGVLYRMTETGYRRYLLAGMRGEYKSPNDAEFGGVRIGEIAMHTVDAEPRDFADCAEQVKGRWGLYEHLVPPTHRVVQGDIVRVPEDDQ